MVVIETNEIPLSIFRWYADQFPESNIATILSAATVTQTVATDEPAEGLYPSQTWASIASGVPYDKHQVYWYGDPKPAEFPLYWQVVAERRSVGLVGTLHSSPLETQATGSGIVFAIPDSFAENSDTIPPSLSQLQELNIEMTQQNGRAVNLGSIAGSSIPAAVSALGHGLRPSSVAELTALVGRIAAKRASKERLRSAQFILHADLFDKLLRKHKPELAVFFTNHVAAAMHRFWYASFPSDWDEPLYDEAWVQKHEHELPAALTYLDRFLGRMADWCIDNDRTLILLTSMGQEANPTADATNSFEIIVDDPTRFARALGVTGDFKVHHAMVPHFTLQFADAAQTQQAANRILSLETGDSHLQADINGARLTVTYHLANNRDRFKADGKELRLDEAGLKVLEVDAHRTGVHQPLGTLMVVNSPTVATAQDPVDYLEIAPAILEALDVAPLDHHKTPSLHL